MDWRLCKNNNVVEVHVSACLPEGVMKRNWHVVSRGIGIIIIITIIF